MAPLLRLTPNPIQDSSQCYTPLEVALERKVVEVSTVKYDPGALGWVGPENQDTGALWLGR